MPTMKPVLKTVEQYMDDYVPVYRPVWPQLLAQGQARSYPEVVGQHEFRRVEAVSDLRSKRITPKDTEMQQIAVNEAKKPYKKYFFANQYIVSQLQDQEGTESVIRQVLDEHNKQMDELLLFGEGTSNSTMINNGIFWSNDANFTEESSATIAAEPNRLSDFHNKVITNATKADRLAGRKLVMFYGTSVLPLYDSLYAASQKAWKVALQEVLGGDYELMKMPAEITPSGANGWLILNLDQTVMHYCKPPMLDDRGSNDEKKYNWFNFLMGSTMVEVIAKDGIIKQPATLA
jgi:hypothetical protein